MSDVFGTPATPSGHRPTQPLGGLRHASDQTRAEQSTALQEAAGNLLEKAYQGLHDGDEQRAHTYVLRAAALPWDEHDGVHPAVMDVDQVLYDELADAREASETGDHQWLTVAGETISILDARAADALTRALAAVGQDYHLTRPEQRMLRDIIGTAAHETYDITLGLTRESSADDVAATIEPILQALVAYHRALRHAD